MASQRLDDGLAGGVAIVAFQDRFASRRISFAKAKVEEQALRLRIQQGQLEELLNLCGKRNWGIQVLRIRLMSQTLLKARFGLPLIKRVG